LAVSRSELKGASFEIAMPGDPCASRVAVEGDVYIEPSRGQTPFQSLRPLDQRHAVVEGFVQADLIGLVGDAEAIEVEMGQGQAAVS
jgi:hypothetical protein